MSPELIRALLPLIPLFPAVAFVVIIMARPVRDNKPVASGLAILAVASATAIAWTVVFATVGTDLSVRPIILTIPWIPTGTTIFNLSLILDPLAGVMLFMVPFVATMIFIYSTGYHRLGTPDVEPYYARFFAYISLFAAGMLLLVIADSLLLFFIAWEIMGLCSYLLIGFWFHKPAAVNAAKKAFITTRVGDTLFFVGLLLLYSATGTLSLHEILTVETVERLKTLSLVLGPFGQLPLLPTVVWLLLSLASGLTALYTGRQLGLVFFGPARTATAEQARESPRSMTIPLVILAGFALLFGFVNIPANLLAPSAGGGWLQRYLEPAHVAALGRQYSPVDLNWGVAGLSGLLAVGGLLGGIALYAGRSREPLVVLGPLWSLLERKYYVDEFYTLVFVRPLGALSTFLARLDSDWLIDPIVNLVGRIWRRVCDLAGWIDTHIVDGLISFIAIVLDELAGGLRLLQTGQIQNYLIILVTAVLVLAALFLQ